MLSQNASHIRSSNTIPRTLGHAAHYHAPPCKGLRYAHRAHRVLGGGDQTVAGGYPAEAQAQGGDPHRHVPPKLAEHLQDRDINDYDALKREIIRKVHLQQVVKASTKNDPMDIGEVNDDKKQDSAHLHLLQIVLMSLSD